MEAGVMCTIDDDTSFSFPKNTIGDSCTSCHFMNNDTGLFNIININKMIQKSSGNMPATKKEKLCVNVQQVDGTEWVHTLWSVKFCPKAGANLFFLTFEHLQGKKISSDHQNKIIVKTTDGNILPNQDS